jgi:hypothetical protein
MTLAEASGERERIVLELVPLASDRPVAVRLRLVLKDLLRQEQFRCVGIRWETMPPAIAAELAQDLDAAGLRALVGSLARRVAGQAEALARCAERAGAAQIAAAKEGSDHAR